VNVDGKVAVVTGGGGGIGGALAVKLVAAGAAVVVADLDVARAQAVAGPLGDRAVGMGGDVASEADLRTIIALAEERFGPVDLFCANAGISGGTGLGDGDADWARTIDVNVMAHVRAARLLVPGWLERGVGYFVSTASAAGLLTQIGAAPYSVTKHAAVGFAEWLSVTYGDRGIAVSCLCPMGVNTNMLNAGLASGDAAEQVGAKVVARAGAIAEPEDVADLVLEAIDDERFLIVPHAEVLQFYRRKSADYDRWLRGMRRLQRAVV
jgi:NAD(P)-dependent dehydrogenase (short-subunit alcohol dehydrogenase family)